jgi:hypothetical protein
MKHITRIWMALVLSAIASIAMAQAFPHPNKIIPVGEWEKTPQMVMDVKWLRTSGFSFVEDGICHFPMMDSRWGVRNGYLNIARCFEQGASKALDSPHIPGAMRILFVEVEAQKDLKKYLMDAYGKDAYFIDLAGFYIHRADSCTVAVWSKAMDSLGHEIKHCFDGQFHTAESKDDARWLEVPAALSK